MALRPGARVGPYEITDQIGAGGMGVVWRAVDTQLGRQVAIKVLPDQFAQDPARLARFELEAKTLASVNHANIAIVHGLESTDGVRALIMEFVEGETLAERIVRGPMSFDEVLPIVGQIADALTVAHDLGIVHRDLKPANIKVRPDGTVKVLDFGLAKALAVDKVQATDHSPTITSPALTEAGVILGTAAYMSPEQARGKPVDRRTDIWSFGCVLYEMLTGRRAFEAEDVSLVLTRILRDEPNLDLLPPDAPLRVHRVIRVCLEKDSRRRASALHDVRLALEGAFEAPGTDQTRARIRRPWWRQIVPLATAALAALLLTGLTAWSLWPGTEGGVNRFDYQLPQNQAFRNTGRSVLAVSADGRHIVYNTMSGLFLRSLDALEARRIPGTEANLTTPIVAPDGQSIAFFRFRTLMRLPINGGVPVVICAAENPLGVSWNSDDTILFGQPEGIMRVPAAGGTPTVVVPAKDGEEFHGPQLLPDGDSILFSIATVSGPDRWNTAQIVVQSLSTGARKILVSGGSDARYARSGHLVYAFRDALFAVAFDVRGLQVRGTPVSVISGVARGAGGFPVMSGVANYSISADGTLVYVAAGSSRWTAAGLGGIPTSTLVWVNRKGEEEPLKAPPRSYQYPRVSPDGTRVAFDVRDQQSDIWIWDFKRQTLSPFTSNNSVDADPVWSPTGERLAWTSNRTGAFDLYWQAADGMGKEERVTDSPIREQPTSFSADGRRLVFTLDHFQPSNPGGDLWMVSLDGDRGVTRLVATPSAEQNGEISPDGRWLAYQSNETGRFEIYVRPFPLVDQAVWRISTNGGSEPLWARSGRELFFLALDGALMAVPVEAAPGRSQFSWGAAAKILDDRGFLRGNNAANATDYLRTYDMSGDGQRFLRIKVADVDDDPQKVIIVQRWFDELERLVPTR